MVISSETAEDATPAATPIAATLDINLLEIFILISPY
jgi:hypothetical protein